MTDQEKNKELDKRIAECRRNKDIIAEQIGYLVISAIERYQCYVKVHKELTELFFEEQQNQIKRVESDTQ